MPREPIEADEVIIDFSDPDCYHQIPAVALEEWQLRGGKFTALTTDSCLISDRLTKYSLLNHSRKPDAAVDLSRRVVYALRAIGPGEEITVDYREEPMPPRVKLFFEPWL